MRTFILICRSILGIVFIFSGFVKGIDPYGLAYKFSDYFIALNLNFLSDFSLLFSFALSFFEIITGAALLFGVYKKLFPWLALIFMCIFTPLTLYIAIENPVTDCGCFGDALIITNWQSFYKNVILLIMAVIVLIGTGKEKDNIRRLIIIQRSAFVLVLTLYFLSVAWSFNHLPLIDFRPYKVGINIKEGMTIPEGAPLDVYSNTYYYRNLKTGETKKFNDDNLPWQDTLNWAFDSMDEPVLVSKGYEPPIHDFYMETNEGDDVADYFLEDDNYTFLLVSYNLEKSNLNRQETINNLADWALSEGYNFICLTSSGESIQKEFKSKTGAPYEFLTGDEITLKTIIRSNPGLLLLKKGTILSKWHYNDIPGASEMEETLQHINLQED